jgi:hypothetical protein
MHIDSSSDLPRGQQNGNIAVDFIEILRLAEVLDQTLRDRLRAVIGDKEKPEENADVAERIIIYLVDTIKSDRATIGTAMSSLVTHIGEAAHTTFEFPMNSPRMAFGYYSIVAVGFLVWLDITPLIYVLGFRELGHINPDDINYSKSSRLKPLLTHHYADIYLAMFGFWWRSSFPIAAPPGSLTSFFARVKEYPSSSDI